MRYVLDASVAVKWVILEADSAKARALRDDFRRAVRELIAPDILPGEVAHVLTKLERMGTIGVGQSKPLMASVLTDCPHLDPYGLLMNRAIDISSRTRSGFFDCLYVALAERESCELVTADDRLVKNLQGTFPFVRSLSSIP